MKFDTFYSGTKLTVKPPQPAPVNLLPIAPAFKAKLVSLSNYGQEHSYKFLQESWLSFIRFPNITFFYLS